jgi:hypothetical protein
MRGNYDEKNRQKVICKDVLSWLLSKRPDFPMLGLHSNKIIHTPHIIAFLLRLSPETTLAYNCESHEQENHCSSNCYVTSTILSLLDIWLRKGLLSNYGSCVPCIAAPNGGMKCKTPKAKLTPCATHQSLHSYSDIS